jgi:hypothetical protein
LKLVSVVSVNQKGANAAGDNVARDKVSVTNVYHSAAPVLQKLWDKLAEEMRTETTTKDWVDNLQFFREKFASDGIIGLEEKLKRAGRDCDTLMAMRQKEMFVKLLTRYELFSSAQEILAFCLHRIQHEFDTFISPKLGELTRAEIDAIISERIIYPVVNDCGAGVFQLNPGLVLGMIYWLGEQCFVRWHS